MRTDMQAQSVNSPNSTSPNHQNDTGMAVLAIALPIILILSILGYRRYRVVRFRWQIERLEKIWQMSSRESRR